MICLTQDSFFFDDCSVCCAGLVIVLFCFVRRGWDPLTQDQGAKLIWNRFWRCYLYVWFWGGFLVRNPLLRGTGGG